MIAQIPAAFSLKYNDTGFNIPERIIIVLKLLNDPVAGQYK